MRRPTNLFTKFIRRGFRALPAGNGQRLVETLATLPPGMSRGRFDHPCNAAEYLRAVHDEIGGMPDPRHVGLPPLPFASDELMSALIRRLAVDEDARREFWRAMQGRWPGDVASPTRPRSRKAVAA